MTVELVGGSRVQGMSNATYRSAKWPHHARPAYLAHRIGAVKGWSLLWESLRAVVDRTRLEPKDGVALAVELEPGPLYVLNDHAGLVALADLLAARGAERYARVVGFNLDVAHWFLAGIDPAKVDPRVVARICHVHISDIGLGHFGDAPLGALGLGRDTGDVERNLRAFAPWLGLIDRVIRGRAGRGRDGVPFSMCASLELEACAGIAPVHESIERLRRLVGME
jgi:hypothetical protein